MLFQQIIELKVGAADAAARSYDLHILRDAPVPAPRKDIQLKIESYVREALNLTQASDKTDETCHTFSLPCLARHRVTSLSEASLALEAEAQTAHACLSAIQAEINDIVFDLYNLNESDRALVCAEMGESGMVPYPVI